MDENRATAERRHGLHAARFLVVACFLAASTPALAQARDHLKCFKVSDSTSFGATVDLEPAPSAPVGADTGCVVKVRSRQLCFPVDSDVTDQDGPAAPVSGQDLENAFLCYRVKCPSAELPSSLQMSDEFGSHTLAGLKVATVCSPAVVGPPPTTTTTLPAGTPRDCSNATPPACDGTCNSTDNACMEQAGACVCLYVDQFAPCPSAYGPNPPECYGTCSGSLSCIDVAGACQCGLVLE